MSAITIHKLNHHGQRLLSYPGQVLHSTATELVVEAFFKRERMELGYVTLKPGDRFVEYFYTDQWYNIFLIYDVDDGVFKGWYCNISRPARWTATELWAEDLALDLFVQPSGALVVLDEEEFEALALPPAEVATARAALGDLQLLAEQAAGPFMLLLRDEDF